MDKDKFKFLIERLDKTTGILDKGRYFNSAVLVPLVLVKDEYHFLFQVRSENITQGGEVCFPGGEFDSLKDNNFEDTAIRETCEELGIKKEKIEIIAEIDTLVAPFGATIDVFVGILQINDINELNINKEEVERVFLVPVTYFIENEPEEYSARIAFQPSYIDESGKEITLLPSKELGLPEFYHKEWTARKNHRILVYKAKEAVIWGITAELVYNLIYEVI